MFLNNNEQQLNVHFKVRHGDGLYAGFVSTDGALSVSIWGIRALHAHIKAIDNVRVQAPVGKIEVNVQGAMRRRQQRLGLVMPGMVV